MIGYRHRARTAAAQCIMGAILRGATLGEELEKLVSFVKSEFLPTAKEEEFFRTLIHHVFERRKEIDLYIKKYAPKWQIESLPAVDRAILEIGIYELLFTDTPTAIVINEAVEIAKEFGDEGSPKFINGVLSSLVKNETSFSQKGV